MLDLSMVVKQVGKHHPIFLHEIFQQYAELAAV
jgi:hypothetical protein